MQTEVWTAREGVSALADEMVGYDVDGRDGRIGKVERVSYEGTCVFVSTGRLLSKKYVIPAGSVERIDTESKTVVVDLSKEEVENSPEYDANVGFDDDCEANTGAYYSDLLAKRTSAQ